MKRFHHVFVDDERPGLEVGRAVNVPIEFGYQLEDAEAWPDFPEVPRWRLRHADLTDLVPVIDAFLVFSPRSREVFDRFAVEGTLDWRAVEIIDRKGDAHPYWAYRWAGPSIALNDDPSTYATKGVPAVVFDRDRAERFDVFGRQGPFSYLTLIISERVWAELERIGATGIRVTDALIR